MAVNRNYSSQLSDARQKEPFRSHPKVQGAGALSDGQGTGESKPA
jgi:hypothetical protein